MTRFTLEVNEYVLAVIQDLCSIQGSHLTIVSNNAEVCLASLCPEYFKLYRTGQHIEEEKLALRIPKSILKPIISDPCILLFSIDGSRITIRKFLNSALKASVTIPLELDFNDAMLSKIIAQGEISIERYDLSPIVQLRAIVPFSSSGLQFKDNLAYIHGQGFIVYRKIKHPLNFILTQRNIAELIAFIKLHGTLQMYEVDNYTIFKHGDYFFGCRQPVNFIDSNYSSYEHSKSKTTVKCSTAELCKILKNFTLPKNEELSCNFDLSASRASIVYNADCKYTVALDGETTECQFKVPVSVLKKMFSNSKLNYNDTQITVYDAFVVFSFGEIDILITRAD